MMIQLFKVLFIVIFFIPVIAFFSEIETLQLPQNSDWLNSLGMTMAHSAFSSTLALMLGGFGALGLSSVLGSKKKWAWQLIAMLPGFIPQIVVLTSVISLASIVNLEVRGFFWLVLIHGLMNVGICAVAIDQLVSRRLSHLISLCLVDGVSRSQFFIKVFIPSLKGDLFSIWLLVFCFCMTSFGIPLIVGSSELSFEIFIYEKVKIESNWSGGLFLGFMQIILIFILARGIHQEDESLSVLSPGVKTYSWAPGKWLLLLLSSLSFCGLLSGMSHLLISKSQLEWDLFGSELFNSFVGTLAICSLTFVVTYLLFFLVSFLFPFRLIHKFFTGFLPPSVVIFGFGLWIIGSNEVPYSYLKISFGLALIFFPALYRWKGGAQFMALRTQIQNAQVLSSSRWQTYRCIILPQCQKTFLWLSGVSAFWASGDFALSSVLNFGTHSLGLLNETLVTAYQFELAALVSFVTLGVGAMFFALGGGLGYIIDQ